MARLMSCIGRLARGIALLRQNDRHDRVAALEMSGIGHIADSFHTKAQPAVTVRSRYQRTADALELAP